MYSIDRSAAIIRPKQPFVDWANQLPDAEWKVSLDTFKDDCHVILIANYDGGDEGALEQINDMCLDLFEEELFGWCTYEQWWPKNRTKEMFWEWFDVELHSLIIDPYEDPIKKGEL